jgi:undecaprenyl-diphosphatase
MDFHTIFYALLLGIVAGLTAFLPISSLGHVIFLDEALHFQASPGKFFEISLQLGATLALCWHYRERLLYTALHIDEKPQQMLVLNIAVAFMPTAVLGAMFHTMITGSLFHIWMVATTFFLGGLAILGVEKWKPPVTLFTLEAITPVHAFVIGMYQSFALIPGVSALAAGILGGMTLGIEREAAAEFSLLLVIPTAFAATLFSFCVNRGNLNGHSVLLAVIGVLAALAAAVPVAKLFIRYISTNSLQPFGWYRVLIGGAMLAGLFAAH